MTGTWTALPAFVLASGDALPDRLFLGYGFDGVDFIVGSEGLDRFEAAGRGRIADGEDGCYTLIEKTAQGHVAGIDAGGQCRLFLYRSGRRWALSNSFAALADRLAAEGWPVTVDPAMLDAWSGHHRSFYSLQAPRTVLREVTFLPAARRVVIAADGTVSVVPRPPRADDGAETYEAAIGRYMAVWLGRILTLAGTPDLTLRQEVTGGMDSRAALAPTLYLLGRGLLPDAGRIDFVSPPRIASDHAVARVLGDRFGFALNAGATGPAIAQDDAARLAAWRRYSLGMRGSPAHLGLAVAFPRRLTLGGHRGEKHRKWSGVPKIDALMAANAGYFRSRRRAEDFRAAIAQAVAENPEPTERGADSIWHQNYRERAHHGFPSQYELRTPPLYARHLEPCHRHLKNADVDDARLLVDLMQRLAPGLADLPYDDPAKMPKAAVLQAAGGPVPDPVEGGAAFLPPDLPAPQVSPAPGSDAGVAALLAADYRAARDRTTPGCLTPPVLAEADQAAAALQRGDSPTRPGMAMLHAVLLSALVAGLAPSPAERLRRPLAAAGDRLRQAGRLVLARLRRSLPGRG